MKKMKRYQEGGEAEGLSGTAGRMSGDKKPRTIDDMTFGQAFKTKLDELGEGKTFTWRGKKYTTDTKKPAAKSAAKADDAPATGRSTAFEESRDVPPARKETQAEKDRRTPGSGAGFKNLAAKFGDTATREKYRAQGYGSEKGEREESAAQRRMKDREESAAERRMKNREESAAERRIKEGNLSFDERMKRFLNRFGTAGQRDETPAMRNIREAKEERESGKKKGGAIKAYRKGGSIDGCAKRGHTRGKIV